jgi:hypothetical protein
VEFRAGDVPEVIVRWFVLNRREVERLSFVLVSEAMCGVSIGFEILE